MSVKEILENGTAICICPDCEKEFTIECNTEESAFADVLRGMYEVVICDDCGEKLKAEERAYKAEQRRLYFAGTLQDRIDKSSIPLNFRSLTEPYVRRVAEWFWLNQKRNLIVSGETGTGKTSSACYVARLMMEKYGISVKYYTRKKFTAAYVQAKKSSEENAIDWFYAKLDKFDLIIIDELVGKKGVSRMTDAEQELYFDLFDSIYSGERTARVWIMGNFFKGAIETLFDDPQPVKRRIEEMFKVAWIFPDRIEDNIKL